MLFPTVTFATFLLIVLGGNTLLRGRQVAWMSFMLAASAVFYAWWDWRFLCLLGASVVVNQSVARGIARSENRSNRQRLLVVAVVANLAGLGWFKYYDFFTDELLDLLGALAPPAPVLNIVLPVGISFFTFQALSYVIDIHRGDGEPATLLEFALYLSFFPQLVAGPIVRASEFLPQLRDRVRGSEIDVTRALVLIGAGLFKKVVVANLLAAELVDAAFAAPRSFSSAELAIAVYAYAIQIYADFSGYTDIAIGVALLFGFRFPENFRQPYAARSLGEFWRRWHMTLSRWLRDYLYIPLGGNRGRAATRDRNLLLTMLLGGLWHGAAWTFVVWGGIHGIGLVVERRLRELARGPGSRSANIDQLDSPASTVAPVRQSVAGWCVPVVQWIVTFHLVVVAWVFFRAPTMSDALDVLRRIVRDRGTDVDLSPMVLILVVGMLIVQLLPRRLFPPLERRVARAPLLVQASLFGVWLVVVDLLGPAGVDPFIYFQF